MSWSGIPFKYFPQETVDRLSIALSEIPKIKLESPTDYSVLAITALVTLFAGLIPALIAWCTFRRNAINTRRERIQQQRFLRVERAAQQRFLIDERAKQHASMEEDRITQTKIAERDFNMQVFSVNRQAWINKLRDLISDYISLAPSLLTVMFDYNLAKNSFDKLVADRDLYLKSNDMARYKELNVESKNKIDACIRALNDSRRNSILLTTKIKLMLNPMEDVYEQLLSSFYNVDDIFNKYNTIDADDYGDRHFKILDEMQLLIDNSQKLFKTEWEKVKKGV
ncbi:hypothetical protein [Serratia liquefaciens]|uniref:hypothetical protein n=1 Tax=Serratia liquefaciens TaxID=614 RepID=UPI003EC6498C